MLICLVTLPTASSFIFSHRICCLGSCNSSAILSLVFRQVTPTKSCSMWEIIDCWCGWSSSFVLTKWEASRIHNENHFWWQYGSKAKKFTNPVVFILYHNFTGNYEEQLIPYRSSNPRPKYKIVRWWCLLIWEVIPIGVPVTHHRFWHLRRRAWIFHIKMNTCFLYIIVCKHHLCSLCCWSFYHLCFIETYSPPVKLCQRASSRKISSCFILGHVGCCCIEHLFWFRKLRPSIP